MSALGNVKSGTPQYTGGWGSKTGFSVSEKGLSIYTAGWFGGQPLPVAVTDDVGFATSFRSELACAVAIQREGVFVVAIQRELPVATSLSSETHFVASIGREQEFEVER